MKNSKRPLVVEDNGRTAMGWVEITRTDEYGKAYIAEVLKKYASLFAASEDMLKALETVEMYARINHDRPKDYAEIVAPALAKARGGL